MVTLTVSRGERKGEEHILLRKHGGDLFGAHVVADKDDVLRPVCPQSIHDRADLRIAHDDKDNVVLILWLELCYHREAGDRHTR